MNFFGHHKKKEARTWDRENQIPVIRASICTGEQTAGFKNIQTGRFKEVMLIRNSADLEAFRKQYGIDIEIKTVY